MKLEGLQLGNLFKEKYSGTIIEVEGITKETVIFSGEFKDLWQAEEILITEEWLSNFGFRKANEKLYFLPMPNFSIEIHAVFFRGQWLIELSNDRKNIVTDVVKVHELQNLFMSITNKPLPNPTKSPIFTNN